MTRYLRPCFLQPTNLGNGRVGVKRSIGLFEISVKDSGARLSGPAKPLKQVAACRTRRRCKVWIKKHPFFCCSQLDPQTPVLKTKSRRIPRSDPLFIFSEVQT